MFACGYQYIKVLTFSPGVEWSVKNIEIASPLVPPPFTTDSKHDPTLQQ